MSGGLEDAFRMVELGLPVFPVLGKKPPIKGGFHNATTDKRQIYRWFRRWPRCGWAVPTGTDLVVVDLDVILAVPAEMMAVLEASTGPRVQTGSGGLHVWYRPPRELRTKVRFVSGTDFKANGGYVLVPHALHPRTRQRYRWLTPPEADLPPLPAEILKRVAPTRPKRRYRRPLLVPRTAVESVRRAERAITAAVPGDRNATLNREAFRLGPFVKVRLLDAREVVAHLEEAAFVAGLDPEETRRTIRSGLLAGMETNE